MSNIRGNANVTATASPHYILIYVVRHVNEMLAPARSCTIDWVKGKNVTLKTIKKKQKHKGRGTVRTVTKTVPNDSFFNFFTPPEGKILRHPIKSSVAFVFTPL